MDRILDKGTERRAKTKFGLDGSGQQKKDMDALVGIATSSGSNLRSFAAATISTVHTLPVRSPPSACLQKLFVMLLSATLKSTFSFSDYNTQITQYGQSNQSKGSS